MQILQLLRGFSESSALKGVAVRLLGETWQQQPRVYPTVEAMLHERAPVTPDMETGLARAAVVRDVCVTSPEQYGEDYVPILFAMLQPAQPQPIAGTLVAHEFACLIC